MNVISLYPKTIDEMIFFQDNDIEKMSVVDSYNSLVDSGEYTEASQYLAQHPEIYGMFAHYINAIENRIYTLQGYLLTKHPNYLFTLSNEEPSDMNEGAIWI